MWSLRVSSQDESIDINGKYSSPVPARHNDNSAWHRINVASEMALNQEILPFPMLRKYICGTKWQKHRLWKSRATPPRQYFFG